MIFFDLNYLILIIFVGVSFIDLYRLVVCNNQKILCNYVIVYILFNNYNIVVSQTGKGNTHWILLLNIDVPTGLSLESFADWGDFKGYLFYTEHWMEETYL